MVKIISTKEIALKYKGIVSVMRPLPKTGKYELYVGYSLYNKIKSNENPEDIEFVYDTSDRR